MKKLLTSLLSILFLSVPAFGMQETQKPAESHFVTEIKALLADLNYFNEAQRKKCVDAITNILDIAQINSALSFLPKEQDQQELMAYLSKKIFKSNQNSLFMSPYIEEFNQLNAEQLVLCYCVMNKSIKNKQEALMLIEAYNYLLSEESNIKNLIYSFLQKIYEHRCNREKTLVDHSFDAVIKKFTSTSIFNREARKQVVNVIASLPSEKQSSFIHALAAYYSLDSSSISIRYDQNDKLIIDYGEALDPHAIPKDTSIGLEAYVFFIRLQDDNVHLENLSSAKQLMKEAIEIDDHKSLANYLTFDFLVPYCLDIDNQKIDMELIDLIAKTIADNPFEEQTRIVNDFAEKYLYTDCNWTVGTSHNDDEIFENTDLEEPHNLNEEWVDKSLYDKNNKNVTVYLVNDKSETIALNIKEFFLCIYLARMEKNLEKLFNLAQIALTVHVWCKEIFTQADIKQLVISCDKVFPDNHPDKKIIMTRLNKEWRHCMFNKAIKMLQYGAASLAKAYFTNLQ